MNTLPYEAPINHPGAIRERMLNLLNQQLADAIDLQLQSRQAQWNISGPQFLSLHLLCDQIAKNVEESVGEIAGRVARLGGIALGTKRAVMEKSRLPEYPLRISSGYQHMDALRGALACFVSLARDAIRTTRDHQDFDSIDVLAHVWQTADKILRTVESYFERLRQGSQTSS